MGVHLGGCQQACPDHTLFLLPGLTVPPLQAVPGAQETGGLAQSHPKHMVAALATMSMDASCTQEMAPYH